jgi:hypothetical protein
MQRDVPYDHDARLTHGGGPVYSDHGALAPAGGALPQGHNAGPGAGAAKMPQLAATKAENVTPGFR